MFPVSKDLLSSEASVCVVVSSFFTVTVEPGVTVIGPLNMMIVIVIVAATAGLAAVVPAPRGAVLELDVTAGSAFELELELEPHPATASAETNASVQRRVPNRSLGFTSYPSRGMTTTANQARNEAARHHKWASLRAASDFDLGDPDVIGIYGAVNRQAQDKF